MMKKGISPVVAVVLLIAIAVIAAVGVWYWVGSYTSKPAVVSSQRAMSITECTITDENGVLVLVRNTGGMTLSEEAGVFNSSGLLAGYLDLSGENNKTSGQVGYVPILNISSGDVFNTSNFSAGMYRIIDPNYPEYTFTCTVA